MAQISLKEIVETFSQLQGGGEGGVEKMSGGYKIIHNHPLIAFEYRHLLQSTNHD